MFSNNQSEEDLKEIESLLVTYLSEKVVRKAYKATDAKQYIQETLRNGSWIILENPQRQ